MSSYKDLVRNMRFSFSRVSTYDNCKYCFYLGYIVKDDDLYLSEGNFYAEVGSFVHLILEKVFKGELEMDDAAQYFIDHFDENVFYRVKKSSVEDAKEDCIKYFAEEEFEWLDGYEVIGVEMKVELDICGYAFVGYLDLVIRDKKTGEISIVDHKSARYPLKKNGDVLKSHQEEFKKHKRQMYLYSHAVKEKYGVFPKWLMWNHFKDQKVVKIPFDIREYDETMAWFRESARKIEDEEEFEPTLNYFFCKNLCNFRNSCEYCQEEWK